MKRQIIQIDEAKCNGCGLCIPNCHEGALQLIDGKARLVSDLFCDGLGACIGHCPEGAITIIEREAEPYDEIKVMESIIPKGRNTILAHLEHLKEHGEEEYLAQAIAFLKENKVDLSPGASPHTSPLKPAAHQLHQHVGGCPGAAMRDFRANSSQPSAQYTETYSELRQWPVQLHLLNPAASYLRGADLVLAADCVAFSMGNFHHHYLKGKSLAIACPKLDSGKEIYVEKLASMVRDGGINTITVVMMEVPCCGGLLHLAQLAMQKAGKRIPLKKAIISVQGEVLEENWLLN
ncbi:MAG: 4Fe-4S binding protein [Bacteroidales bacterium]|jgi:NAD-dependent dihydropyrimidine dehydrogenase PreA subunit|nr:4Fe-4S binding protein [Bacteroidales bacterium]